MESKTFKHQKIHSHLEYMYLFQDRNPLIHLLHPTQVGLLKKFLACFVKPEKLCGIDSDDLVNLELASPNLLKRRDMFLGEAVNKILSTMPTGIISFHIIAFVLQIIYQYISHSVTGNFRF